jgi:multidrug transporter EmrE-like cation transporter
MRYVLALFVALVLNACANLLMKVGMKSVEASGGLFKDGVAPAFKTVLTSAPLLVGLTCFVLNAGFYMYALQSKSLKISLAYPIMVGGGFAFIAVIARLHPSLAERLTWGQFAGVGLVLAGVILIAAQSERVPM